MKDLWFAFNDKDFSDRMLYVEIVSDSLASCSDSADSDTEGRGKRLKKAKGNDVHDNDSKCSAVVEVKTLHINSAILAADSPFFFKLFKNGMRESIEKHVTMRISASEEVALMDLLSFMYKSRLSATSAPDLLNVLMIADKYEVTSCARYCCKLLQAIPLSLESAILYLDLPSSLLMGDVKLLPLKDAAKKYLGDNFTISFRENKRMMDLPLSAVEVVLAFDGLQVDSEQDVYEFILRWARTHYPNLEERREILTKRLARFIYFPFLCMSTLKEIQVCPDFNSKEMTNLVFENIYLNMGFENVMIEYEGYDSHIRLSGDPATANNLGRVYQYFPVRAFEIESPNPHCVVYFCLTENMLCTYIVEDEAFLPSQRFRIGEEWFVLNASNNISDAGDMEHLCLWVTRHDYRACPINAEFAVISPKSSHKFQIIDNYVNDDVGNTQSRILWTALTDKDDNSVLHIRAKVSVKYSQG